MLTEGSALPRVVGSWDGEADGLVLTEGSALLKVVGKSEGLLLGTAETEIVGKSDGPLLGMEETLGEDEGNAVILCNPAPSVWKNPTTSSPSS